MPLNNIDLRQYLNPVFIETGTHKGGGIILALAAGFQHIYSMDIESEYVTAATHKFFRNDNVHLFLGDSGQILLDVLPTVGLPITFWLDAHPPGPLSLTETPGRLRSPLLAELSAIARSIPRLEDCVILIDDLRLLPTDDVNLLTTQLETMSACVSLTQAPGIVDFDILVANFFA